MEWLKFGGVGDDLVTIVASEFWTAVTLAAANIDAEKPVVGEVHVDNFKGVEKCFADAEQQM